MPDPFLEAHRVGNLPLYNLGSPVSPISIKDQMVRACLLVDRLVEQAAAAEEEPGAFLGPLLVIGAGACGATVAIAAAEQGITTLLVDKATYPFGLQLACTSRWIDPTQYDWPLDHCWKAVYPWEVGPPNRPVPLPWTGDRCHRLAWNWRLDLLHARRRYQGRLFYLGATTSVIPHAPGPVWSWTLQSSGGHSLQVSPKTVVLAVGFGEENVWFSSQRTSRGYFFWETDPFEKPGAGVPAGLSTVEVLISGSGDGALQDFLRVATGKRSAREIYHALGLNALPGIEEALQSVSDRTRALLWGTGNRHDHPWHLELHEECRRVAGAVLRDSSDIGRRINHLTSSRFDRLHLVFGCSHFTNTYLLNRFLVLLVAEYWKTKDERKIVFRAGQRVKSVVCGAHCNPSSIPNGCHGRPHTVELVKFPKCYGEEGKPLADTVQATVVILRHGNRGSLPNSLAPNGNLRQELPFSLKQS